MGRPEIGQSVVVEVPATTANLGPGFDCLGAALELGNYFELRVIEGPNDQFKLIIEGPEGAHLRGGPDNLIYRSAQRVWREAGLEPVALQAKVNLAVPPARGLGSSATAIVAGLIGANALINNVLSTEKLLELAIDIEGHPDNVVPSLLGGLCLTARSAADHWRVVHCEWHRSVQAVVAIPSIRLSTSEARRAMPRSIPISDAVYNLGALTILLQGLRYGNSDLIREGLHDRIHEPYRWPLIQGGCVVRDAAIAAGAWGCVISGAGPSLLALCAVNQAEMVSKAIENRWQQEGIACRTHSMTLQKRGSHCSSLPKMATTNTAPNST